MNNTMLLADDPFLVLLFVSYTLLSYISFNLERAGRAQNAPEEASIGDQLLQMFFYAFYQPYMISLIVIYPDFERQMRERRAQRRDWRAIALFTARIAFWWATLEFALHFLYFNSMLQDANFTSKLPKNELVTLGMAIGEKRLNSKFNIINVLIFNHNFSQLFSRQICRYIWLAINFRIDR